MPKGTCMVEGCERVHYGRGWCKLHHERWKKHGDPLWLPPPLMNAICSIEGCDRPTRARGWCATHWSRWRRWGVLDDPLFMSTLDRFRSMVNVNPGGCWEWTGKPHNFGYGRIKVDGKTIWAHRFAYVTFVGPIPEDKPCVLHHCDNPLCVNPWHLFVGTRADNVHDMDAKGRRRTKADGRL